MFETDTLAEVAELATSNEPRVLVDTRSAAEFASGHIPGAVNMPEIFSYVGPSTREGLHALEQTFAALFGAAGLSGSERAIVYEEAMDSGNGKSCRGYFLLKYLGYPKVSVLHGGFSAWIAAGLPATREVAPPLPARFPLSVQSELMLTQADIRAALSDPNAVRLDVRDVDEWNCTNSTPSARDPQIRPGRLPGARWLPWKALLEGTAASCRFRSNEQVLELCRAVGITPSSRVLVYCFKGSRASSTLVALWRAGITDARNYFASWNEWGRDPALPIECEYCDTALHTTGLGE